MNKHLKQGQAQMAMFAKGGFLAAQGALWAYSALKARKQEAEVRRIAEEAQKPPDPMEGLATADELNPYYRHEKGAFYLGRIHEDHGINMPAGVLSDCGVTMIAGAGAGKGVSFYVQNALRWPGPLVCVDAKGEAASITAMRRGTEEKALGTGTSVRPPYFLGQTVGILDPLGEVRGPARKAYRVRYNPLVDIDMTKGGGVRQIRAIAEGLVVPETGGSNEHFSESAETLIAGVIETMMLTEKKRAEATLPKVRRVLLGEIKTRYPGETDDDLAEKTPYDNIADYLRRPTVSGGGLAREALSIVEDVGGDEWSGYRSTLSRALKWMAEPDMQDHLAGSDFSLWDTVQGGGSVYFVLPSNEMHTFKSWLRVVISMALAAKVALGANNFGPRTLFMLDEFPALGRMKSLEKAAAEMRGYGVALCPVIQNIGQLTEIYGRNWETFIGNSAALVAWGLNDGETEDYVATRLGKIMSWEFGSTLGAGSGSAWAPGSANQSTGGGWKERPVRFPNQVRVEGAPDTKRAFVIPRQGKAFTVRRMPYFEELSDRPIFDSPQFIKTWEREVGGAS